MSVIEKFTTKVSDTAKAAARKSGELVEVTKLNAAINQETEKIDKNCEYIGRIIYDNYSKGEKFADDIKAKCEEIDECTANIYGMRVRINELRKIKLCSNCSYELEQEDIYCPKCGTKQAVSEEKDESED